MLLVRVTTSTPLTSDVVELLGRNPAVTGLTVVRGVVVEPPGDLVTAELPREAANDVVDQLCELGVHHQGSLHLEPVRTRVSRPGFDAERRTPGSSADAVVWADVTHQAYAESELNWTYVSFMTMATLIAAIAIVLDSQVLVLGAMVLGPEFVAVAALGLDLVRRRYSLCMIAARTLLLGFIAAIMLTTLAALAARALGWIVVDDVTGTRPSTGFIYSPDKWSFIIALIAAAAGVLSLTSARVGSLSGVFISVTTVPAAGNIALGLAFGVGHEIAGSTLQLAVNPVGMAIAGWITLAIQQTLWGPMAQGSFPGMTAGNARKTPTRFEPPTAG